MLIQNLNSYISENLAFLRFSFERMPSINYSLQFPQIIYDVLKVSSLFFVSRFIYKMMIQPFFSPLRKIPGLPYNPLFGNVRLMFKGQAMESHIKLVKEYGPMVRYYFLFGRERILIADFPVFKHIMVTNHRNYQKPTSKLRFMIMLLRDGIVTTKGKQHAKLKRLMTPAFNKNSVHKMLPVFTTRAKSLVNYWNNIINNNNLHGEQIIEIQKDFSRLTLDVIGDTSFGFDFQSLENPDFHLGKVFYELLGGLPLSFKLLIPYYTSLPLKKFKNFENNVKYVQNFVLNIIKNKRKYIDDYQGDFGKAKDLLEVMMCTRDKETGEVLTDQELVDQVVTIMMAGHETTAVSLTWTLLMLANNSDIQSKLREEVKGYQEELLHKMEYVDNFRYLDSVIKESLRLYPPVAFTLRYAVKDDVIGKYTVPKGTLITLAIGAMMRRDDLFPNASDFKPERFEREDQSAGMESFIPFIIGPRMCIGYKFALMEMKIVLIILLSHFYFSSDPHNSSFSRKTGITMKPEPSVTLRIQRV